MSDFTDVKLRDVAFDIRFGQVWATLIDRKNQRIHWALHLDSHIPTDFDGKYNGVKRIYSQMPSADELPALLAALEAGGE
jgi:hypothetical protein